MQLLPWRGAVSVAACLMACAVVFRSNDAKAFDLFGLFGSDDTPPAASSNALPYALTFRIAGDRKAVEQPLKDASGLYRLRQEPPLEGDSLTQRAEADFGPMLDALWGAGYYNATLAFDIGGSVLTIGTSSAAAARAADRYRGRAPVPVRVVVDTGPLFVLRRIETDDARTRG